MDDMEKLPNYDGFLTNVERVKRTTESGHHYWTARDIQPLLGYANYQKFEEVIERAKLACETSGVDPDHQFAHSGEMIEIGKGAHRERSDWFLSRYACYMIAMTADGSKREVAYAKTYFAIQTRRQEQFDELTAAEKRMHLRNRVKDANKSLASAAKGAGVKRHAIFQDAGYKGLYGGKGQADIKAYKGIPANQVLLDCIDRAELAANEFRITQTEQKLRRDNVSSEVAAINTHHDVGREVRDTIKKIGGTMPEDLPAAPPIRKLIAAKKKALKRGKA